MGSPKGVKKWDWYETPERQLILVLMYIAGKSTQKGVTIKEEQYFEIAKTFIPHVLDYFDTKGISKKQILNRFKNRADKTNRPGYESENPENRPENSGRFLPVAKKIILDNKPLSREDVSRIVQEIAQNSDLNLFR